MKKICLLLSFIVVAPIESAFSDIYTDPCMFFAGYTSSNKPNGPEHVIRGASVRYSLNTGPLPTDVDFYPEGVYFGSDKSDWHGSQFRADMNTVFSGSLGISYIIANVANVAHCNNIYIQSKAPSIKSFNLSKTSYNHPQVSIDVDYDTLYSKAAISGSGIKYKYSVFNSDYGEWDYFTTYKSTYSFQAKHSGMISIFVNISDGTYSVNENLGSMFAKGIDGPCSGPVCQKPY